MLPHALPVGHDQLLELDQVDVHVVICLHDVLAALTPLGEPAQQHQGLQRQVGVRVDEGLLKQTCNHCFVMFRLEWRVQYSKDVVSLLLHTYTLKDGIYYLQYCLAPEVCPRAAVPRTQAAPGYYHKFQICTNKHNRIYKFYK